MPAQLRPIAIAIGIALSSCSTGDYPSAINAFEAGTKAAAVALANYEDELDRAVLEANAATALGNRSALRPAAGTCTQGTTSCVLVIRTSATDPGRPFNPGPIAPEVRSLMNSIVNYSEALKSIATADTESAIKTATSEAKANILSLAETTDKLAKQHNLGPSDLASTAARFANPVADAVVYLLGKYVDHLKLDALRKATAAMQPILPEAARVFGVVADAGNTIKRNAAAASFIEADMAFQIEPRTRAKLDALRSAAEAYNATLTVRPQLAFDRLTAAHAALTAALAQQEPTFDQLWVQLNALSDELEKISKIAKDLHNAANPPK